MSAPSRAARRPDRRSAARACAARRTAGSRRRESASAAVSGRNAVPALPRNRSAFFFGNARRRRPRTQPADVPGVDARRRASRSASSITRVSSASSRSCTCVSPLGERGQQQHAVGDALRAGQADRAGGAARPVPDRGVMHASLVLARAASAPVRAARASVEQLLERRAVAGLEQLADGLELRLVAMRFSASSASRFATQMSRHISGELEAMRVKSRNPPAAKPNSSRRVVAPGDLVHQREREQVRQMAHRGEHARRAPRRHARDARAARRPQHRARARHRSLRVLRDGVSTTRRAAEQIRAGGVDAALLRARRSDAPARIARSWSPKLLASRPRPRRAWCCRRR